MTEVRELRDGGDLPPADVVIWDLEDRTRLVFRPSGTEPKLKVYLEVVRDVPGGIAGYEATTVEAARALAALRAELAALLDLPVGTSAQ